MATVDLEAARRRAIAGIFDGYKVDFFHELGRGGFGTVYQGWDRNNSNVAIKKITRGSAQLAEAVKLSSLKSKVGEHPNIITTHHIKAFEGAIWIVMEQCDLGDLNKYFQDHFEEQTDHSKLLLMKQIMTGIKYLHHQNVIHRDIKPGNTLVKRSGKGTQHTIKLADFGLCKILEDDESSTMHSNVGTNMFKAPEFWSRKPGECKPAYDRSVDIYAAGLTFAAILQAKKGKRLRPQAECSMYPAEPMHCLGEAAYKRKVQNQPELLIVLDSEADNQLARHCKQLIRSMTHILPQNRPTAASVEKHLTELISEMSRRRYQDLDFGITFKPQSICFLGKYIVARGLNMGNPTLCVLDFAVGQKEYVPISDCVHTSLEEPAPLAAFNVTGLDENVLEACPGCSVIRLFNLSSGTVHRICGNMQARDLCMGPNNIILVVQLCGSALQLASGLRGVSPIQFDGVVCRFTSRGKQIVGVQYSRLSDIVVMARKNPSEICGFKLNELTFSILWKYKRTICDIPLDPTAVSSITNSNILVLVNTNKELFVMSFNGANIRRVPLLENIQWATFDDKYILFAKLSNGKFVKYLRN